MLATALAALLSVTTPQTSDVPVQRVEPATHAETSPVQLEDIVVSGRPLNAMIQNFVDEVAAPNQRRGLARWEDSVCVGTANLRSSVAQPIIDRVSTIARDLDLRAGAPGCRPNIIIVVTENAGDLAETLTQRHARTFRLGGPGMDRGGAALRQFVASDAPVRWWQVSLPSDSSTGLRAVRIPGDADISGVNSSNPMTYAPVVNVFAASRLSTSIVDNLTRTIVIVDIDKIGQISTDQLADYIAMVAFAQIDPEADTSRYASVLNLFSDPANTQGLTDWDKAYLEGLYGAQRTQKNLRAGHQEVIASIHRAHGRLRSARDE